MDGIGINFSYWAMQTVAMLLTALFIPRLRIHGPIPALVTVICLAFFNAHFWDAALFFNLPTEPTKSTVVLFFLNGLFFWILVKLLPGIEVKGFLPALIAPVVFTISNLLIMNYGSQINWVKVYQTTSTTIAQLKDYVTESSGAQGKEEDTMKAMPKAGPKNEDPRY